MDSTFISLGKKVDEKGSDGVQKSNERFTQKIDDNELGFTAQARELDFYASLIGLGDKNSSNVTTSESPVLFLKPDGVEEIM